MILNATTFLLKQDLQVLEFRRSVHAIASPPSNPRIWQSAFNLT